LQHIDFRSGKLFILYWIILGCLPNCDSYDPTAPGPQPHIIESVGFQKILNVFGILRPDSLETWPLSYIHLDFTVPPGGNLDSTWVTDAEVLIKKQAEQGFEDSIHFEYTHYGIFDTPEYRNSSFFPESGTYQLICRRQGFPALTAETTVPGKPAIRDNLVRQVDHTLSFSLIRDSLAGLVEVTIEGKYCMVQDRILRPEQGNIPVVMKLPSELVGPCMLTVYAFDLNLSAYMTTNLSIKPNIYQVDFSTVKNGIGCFGSMSIMKRKIEIE
jgi:hypothetical protein